MRRISRTSAIPAHQQFVSRTQTLLDQICCPTNFPFKVFQRLERPD
jgi:hypothetical protein